SAGWTRNSSLDDNFVRGAATYGGTGGSSSHSHAQVSCTSGGANGSFSAAYTSGGAAFSHTGHTHVITSNLGTATNVLPPYQSTVFCSNSSSNLLIPEDSVGLFDTSVPSGWTRNSSYDDRFPQGSATFGSTGGSATHT